MINAKSKIDVIGTVSSMVCAVHCMAFPLLLSLGIVGGAHSLAHDTIELIIILASIILATLSVRQAIFKSHHKFAQILLAGGICLLVFSFIFIKIYTHQVMAIGGFCIAIGHLLNYRAHRTQKRFRSELSIS